MDADAVVIKFLGPEFRRTVVIPMSQRQKKNVKILIGKVSVFLLSFYHNSR